VSPYTPTSTHAVEDAHETEYGMTIRFERVSVPVFGGRGVESALQVVPDSVSIRPFCPAAAVLSTYEPPATHDVGDEQDTVDNSECPVAGVATSIGRAADSSVQVVPASTAMRGWMRPLEFS
jgi:hypothetical protein